jgi:hypothetical protein
VRKRRTVVNARATQRITTRMARAISPTPLPTFAQTEFTCATCAWAPPADFITRHTRHTRTTHCAPIIDADDAGVAFGRSRSE